MTMVKSRYQLNRPRQQHTVPKHVARHIANTNHPYRILVDIDSQLPKMTLYRHPGTTGCDSHFFVVIALAAARCECIPKPKIETIRNRVRQIRKRRSALIGGHNKVRIIGIVYPQLRGSESPRFILIIRDFQKRIDKALVTRFTQFKPRGLIEMQHRFANNKTAFCTNRNDHRILDLLRFDKPQYFSSKIFTAIRPAQPTSGYQSTA